MTQWQCRWVVVVQASLLALIGLVFGVPLGIALGRYLWDLFARQINVIPEPSVPVLIVVLVIAGALVAANLVAAIPGHAAARVPAAALLRTE